MIGDLACLAVPKKLFMFIVVFSQIWSSKKLSSLMELCGEFKEM
jgi:hypothetical protein